LPDHHVKWGFFVTSLRLRPGDMFYHRDVLTRFPDWLATNYRWQNAHRPPVAVILPDTTLFLIDGLPCSKARGYYSDGYDVHGEPPAPHSYPTDHRSPERLDRLATRRCA
jgi:hypothetical protein